ncbi:MAG: RNA polymerase sigma-70 factor [Bacteroidota bacterium]
MTEKSKEEEFLAELRQGSASGLDGLFRLFYVDLCRTSLRIVNDERAAEDIVQEVFLHLWQKRFTLPVMQSVGAYLRRSARNRSLNYLRDQKRIPKGDGEFPQLSTLDNEASAQLELAELQAKVNRAIDALPERCRLIFVLSRFEGMSHKEISEALDISIKTVENQMGRAYRYLREYLSAILLIVFCVLT